MPNCHVAALRSMATTVVSDTRHRHPMRNRVRLDHPLIIQTILLEPSGAVWTDEASSVGSLDPSGADQVDAEHPTRNRKVVGSNPTSGSISAA